MSSSTLYSEPEAFDFELLGLSGRVVEAIWTKGIETMGTPFVSRSTAENSDWKVTYVTNQKTVPEPEEACKIKEILTVVLARIGYTLVDSKCTRFEGGGKFNRNLTAVSAFFCKTEG